MKKLNEQFKGDLNEYDSVLLAKELFKFGLGQVSEYPKCEMVTSFFIDDNFKQTGQWLPYLKLAFNWTKDIDNDFKYLVNFTHNREEFIRSYKELSDSKSN